MHLTNASECGFGVVVNRLLIGLHTKPHADLTSMPELDNAFPPLPDAQQIVLATTCALKPPGCPSSRPLVIDFTVSWSFDTLRELGVRLFFFRKRTATDGRIWSLDRTPAARRIASLASSYNDSPQHFPNQAHHPLDLLELDDHSIHPDIQSLRIPRRRQHKPRGNPTPCPSVTAADHALYPPASGMDDVWGSQRLLEALGEVPRRMFLPVLGVVAESICCGPVCILAGMDCCGRGLGLGYLVNV